MRKPFFKAYTYLKHFIINLPTGKLFYIQLIHYCIWQILAIYQVPGTALAPQVNRGVLTGTSGPVWERTVGGGDAVRAWHIPNIQYIYTVQEIFKKTINVCWVTDRMNLEMIKESPWCCLYNRRGWDSLSLNRSQHRCKKGHSWALKKVSGVPCDKHSSCPLVVETAPRIWYVWLQWHSPVPAALSSLRP